MIYLFARMWTALALWFSVHFGRASSLCVCPFPCRSFHLAFPRRTMIYPLPFRSFLLPGPFSTHNFLVSFISSFLAVCFCHVMIIRFPHTSLATFIALSLFIFVVQRADDIFFGQNRFIRVSIISPLPATFLPFVSSSLLR